jgi:hypothetical protein
MSTPRFIDLRISRPPGRLDQGQLVKDVNAAERRLSHSLSGRGVFGWSPAPEAFLL